MNAQAASPLFLLLMVLPVVVLATVGWIGKTRALAVPPALDAWIASSPWAPVVAGVISALLTWFVWGSLNEGGVVHDERAYLLQARIFARGEWTGTPPPLATFFEQMHVFIDPRLAAKYPPGHALLLVPGVWLGVPGLVPVLIGGLSGALIFLIARQVVGAVPALAGWALWSTSVPSLQWRASYFSQTTGGVLWLLSLWALLGWRRDRRWHQLAIVVTAIAWMYLTRPLTAVAVALPLGVVILGDLLRDARRWRQLAIALVLSVPIVLLNFLWQEGTSGHWLSNPYPEYSRVYFPFDKPGFGFDPSPPLHSTPENDLDHGIDARSLPCWDGTPFNLPYTIDVLRGHEPFGAGAG
jgi:hypothetical protein